MKFLVHRRLLRIFEDQIKKNVIEIGHIGKFLAQVFLVFGFYKRKRNNLEKCGGIP